ncbi:replication restart helicase PriA [Fulvivirga sedimenti]|uniref:Replication restart protein PriA n=1 Tax=Fulvivirga sedimenti TaxID=2879465 RepID=A0A9X1KW65_9BACT|nr:primosomal protein N' [Fulvivirga sedimenti]MCA6073654.1 primosomal protein N' [Fulvivirga sedimenti]
MMRKTLFADLILPVPIANRFTYRIPREMESLIIPGVRVVVPFGKRRMLTGIVDSIHEKAPVHYEARYIYDVLDESAVVTPHQITFIDWMASYYMATPGEVLNAAIPAGLKISTESYVQLNPQADLDELDESDTILDLLHQLEQRESLRYEDIKEITGEKDAFKTLQYLSKKGLVILYEEVRERYSPKTEKYIHLATHLAGNDKALNETFETLARAPKQEDALLACLQLIKRDADLSDQLQRIPKKALLDSNASAAAIQALIKKGILEESEVIVSRFSDYSRELKQVTLSPEQQKAVDQIIRGFDSTDVVLLHGVTGSGKTEIYMDIMQHVLDNDMQILYLLPEIALTTQIVQRLRAVFGDKLGVYHSRYSDNERVEVWQGVLSGRYQIVVGVRSSIFLPFDHLGLVIIDEEHEHSYKQYDPAPRYHARDAAIMLASQHKARVILGSATPSMESNYLADSGKYSRVRLENRFGDVSMPEINVIDTLRKTAQKKMSGPFSDELLEGIQKTMDSGQQVILFQNRRGYAPYMACHQCGHIPHCSQCAVSLTYHQYGEKLICHYCGMRESVPIACDSCGAKEMKPVGLGTEKLEEEVALLFPEAGVRRMDLDTTRTKNSYERILNDFAEHQFDILVGTQMVTKGLDFGGVGLVGIIDLDLLLHYPDFRSHERAFQMAIQVSGRAGRRDTVGNVFIQTRDLKHPVVQQIMHGNYDAFYSNELEERKEHAYPPFTRMIRITIKHKDRNITREAAQTLERRLSAALPVRILGPQEPLVNRVRNEYINELWIKLERKGTSPALIKKSLLNHADNIKQEKLFRSIRIIFNVDPY